MENSFTRRRVLMIGIAASVIVVLGLFGTAVAAINGWITLPYNVLAPKPVPPTFAEVTNAVSSVHSGNVAISFAFQVQPKQEGTPIFPIYPPLEPDVHSNSTTTSTQASTSTSTIALGKRSASPLLSRYLASDTHLTAKIATTFDNANTKDVDGSVTASYSSSGLSLDFDVAYRRVAENLYLRINSFPLPILDFAALAGTWVTIPGDSTQQFSFLLGGQDADTEVWKFEQSASSTKTTLTEQQDRFAAEAKILNEELFAKQAISLENPRYIHATSGSAVWRFDVVVHPQAIREAFIAAVDRRPSATTPVILTDDVRQHVDREAFVTWLTELISALTVQIDVDAQTKFVTAQTWHYRYIPNESELASRNQEHVIDMSYVLTNVNQPVTVSVPENPISLKKASQQLMHQSEDQVRFADQVRIVDDLHTAFMAYYKEHKAYPAALSELIGTTQYSLRVVNIPVDQYTQQPFVYTRNADGQDFTLVYQIHFPPEKEDPNVLDSMDYYREEYVEGTNTATKFFKSREDSVLDDGDGDGLNDADEYEHGTYPTRKDSDNDGYTDKQEIDSHNDPLKNSKTHAVTKPYKPPLF